MNIPTTVRNYLARQGGQYKVHAAAEGLSLPEAVRATRLPVQKLVRSVVLKDGASYLMAIYPATHRLDPASINASMQRNFSPCNRDDLARLLGDCDVSALPPLGEPYGLRVIVDRAVDNLDEVFFNPGVAHLFIRAQQADFNRLTATALRGLHFSSAASKASSPAETQREGMKQKVEQVSDLPPMPGIAAELIKLRNNPYAHASELAAIIEQDPSLTAQLLRYASSPFYGYQGELLSVEQAIVRVLGMDFVLDFSLGLALGKSFRTPKAGPLGVDKFWRDALHVATLTQTLCNYIDYTRRPSPGMAYSAGLLHNFGFLLRGHLFPPQFERLNKAVAAQPERPVVELERELLSVSHTELGVWLMEAWNLPPEIIEAVREHHNADFRGNYAIYPNLVYLANCLLKRFDIGDATGVGLPMDLLQAVGLDEERAEAALGTVLKMREGLQFMAGKMAA